MTYAGGGGRLWGVRSAVKERAVEREKNAGAAANCMQGVAHGAELVDACAMPAASGRLSCIIMPTPCPCIARAQQLVLECSAQQGGGACAVMMVQADGQVLQFSVAAVRQLVPLRKSESRVCICSCVMHGMCDV